MGRSRSSKIFSYHSLRSTTPVFTGAECSRKDLRFFCRLFRLPGLTLVLSGKPGERKAPEDSNAGSEGCRYRCKTKDFVSAVRCGVVSPPSTFGLEKRALADKGSAPKIVLGVVGNQFGKVLRAPREKSGSGCESQVRHKVGPKSIFVALSRILAFTRRERLTLEIFNSIEIS